MFFSGFVSWLILYQTQMCNGNYLGQGAFLCWVIIHNSGYEEYSNINIIEITRETKGFVHKGSKFEHYSQNW